MSNLICIRASIPFAPKKPTSLLARLLSLVLMSAAVGCGEDPASPTVPDPDFNIKKGTNAASFRVISTGLFHTCALDAKHRAFCWGSNVDGQLGVGTLTTISTPIPVAVAGGLRFRKVKAGVTHTCGVTTSDRAYCWGSNLNGQLGDGTTTDRSAPVAVFGGLLFRDIAVANRQTCGVTLKNVAYCWGVNISGQLGDGTHTDRHTPVIVAGGRRFRHVSTGTTFTCGVTVDRRAFCWGRNFDGQLGDGTTTERLVPTAVVGGLRFRQVIASQGGRHTCGLTLYDKAYCWGTDFAGELGDGATADSRPRPTAVVGGLKFRQIALGESHTCGVTLRYRAYCWGSNANAQLGLGGPLLNRSIPTAVSGGLHFRRVTAGGDRTCGLTLWDKAYCWGSNVTGAVGDGTTNSALTPTLVSPPAD